MMSDKPQNPPSSSPGKAAQKARAQARAGAALRENLQRRKALTRAREGQQALAAGDSQKAGDEAGDQIAD